MDTIVVPEAGDLGTSVGLHAGFPNAAADHTGDELSLDRLLITSPSSTFFFRIRGHHWQSQGIFDGDIALVDRSISPQQDSMVIWWTEFGELHLGRGKQAASQNTWGVVTAIIHQYS